MNLTSRLARVAVSRIAAASLVVLLLAADLKREADPDIQAMQGNWEMTSWQINGAELIRKKGQKVKATIAGNRYVLDPRKGDRALDARFKIDASRSPKQIDFLDDQGKVEIKGIYKIEGDVLTICWLDENNRPTDFVTRDRPGYRLFVLKRVKP